jgi:uncharacterized coiled-coil DUF342 family protein
MTDNPSISPDRSKPGEAASARSAPAPSVAKEVHTLATVIKQLEGQLDQMMVTNEALRKDHLDERTRRLALEVKVDELNEKLRRSERMVADKENLLAEVKHVNRERVRLAASARELGERLKELTEQKDADLRKVERLRAAHTDAIEEVQSVEAQFERAMQVVAQTRAQLAIACEERDQHQLRAKTIDTLLGELRQERDALVTEVEQSRAALDEIRQSLVDVALVSDGNTHETRASAGR